MSPALQQKLSGRFFWLRVFLKGHELGGMCDQKLRFYVYVKKSYGQNKKWFFFLLDFSTFDPPSEPTTLPIFLTYILFESPSDASNARTRIVVVGFMEKSYEGKMKIFFVNF